MRPTFAANPGRLGAAAQCRYFPPVSGSQIVQDIPLPLDSTNRAMIVSTSDNSDPARIKFRMLRTDSLEKKPDAFCARPSFGSCCAGNCVADFIPTTAGRVRLAWSAGLGQSETETAGKDLFLGYTAELREAPCHRDRQCP